MGCGGARYYGGVVLPEGHLTPRAREYLLARVPVKIQESRPVRIAVSSAGETLRVLDHPVQSAAELPDLTAVPVPALAALLVSLDKSLRGAELDLLIPVSEEESVPVTVLHEPDGALQIQQGPARPAESAPAEVATPAEIRARYAIELSDFGEASWTRPFYATVEKALSLLSQEERAILARVPIVREHHPNDVFVPKSERAHVDALYTQRRGMARIELYDQLLSNDERLFCGAPEAPLPRSVLSILHEVGHVIADAARADALRDLSKAAGTYQSLEDRLSTQRPGPSEGTFLVTAEEAAALEDKYARFERGLDRATEMGRTGPVLRAYRSARDHGKGPTPYGRTSLSESFAEAFALFRADPAALRRVDPGAFAWFEGGGHLRALAD